MKENGIRAEIKRRFRKTTDSRHDYTVAANLLLEGGCKRPLWTSDITFVPTGFIHYEFPCNIYFVTSRATSSLGSCYPLYLVGPFPETLHHKATQACPKTPIAPSLTCDPNSLTVRNFTSPIVFRKKTKFLEKFSNPLRYKSSW